jgi:type IX secretion system PorP/SprF family membrane protein
MPISELKTQANVTRMRNIRNIVAVLLAFTFSGMALAQQTTLVNHYYVNPFLSNPSMAGESGTNLYLLNRSQWVDVDGAPETFLATIDGMVGNTKFGFGLTMMNDVVNIVGQSSIYGTYTYKLPVFAKSQLSFGMSIGFEQNKLLFDRIRASNPVEITLINNVENKTNFDANTGLTYTWENLRLGVSAYQLLANKNEFVDELNDNSYVYAFRRHYVANIGYRMELEKDKVSLDPYVQMRMAYRTTPQYDVNLMLNFADVAWIGGGFRTKFGGNVMVGGVLANRLLASYSYGRSVGVVEKLSANSHEFMLGYKFNGIVNRKDSDQDGVMDAMDKQPNSPEGCDVDEFGVALDADFDGVPNCLDLEPNSIPGSPVDEKGIALDQDSDGVPDVFDGELNTPKDCPVDRMGVATDIDFDGVPDCIDMQLKSPIGAPVDENGVAIDSDKDLVPDFYDLEPHTPHIEHINGEVGTDASECIVDKHGVATDTDDDGITDCVDKEPLTPRGALVDKYGISIDTDGDGVADGIDAEIDSPKGSKVDKWGRSLPDGNTADDDKDGIPNAIDLEPNTPPNTKVDDFGRSQKPVNPITVNKLDIKDMVDNSLEWEYYMIIGVFKVQNNVKGYQAKLKSKYGEHTKVLVTSAGYYYVWTKKVLTREEAKKEVKRLTSKNVEDYIVGNPWLWKEPKKK